MNSTAKNTSPKPVSSLPSSAKEKVKKTQEEILQDLKTSYEQLNAMETHDNQECLTILKRVSKFYWDYSSYRKEIADEMADLKYSELLIKMLKTFNRIGVFTNDDVWFPTYYTMNLMWNYSDASAKLCQELINEGIVEIVGANLEHKPYLENQSSKNVAYVLKSSLSILQNLTRLAKDMPECQDAFEKATVKGNLHTHFLTSENDFFKCVATMVITAIISEEENKMLDDTGAIRFIVVTLHKAIMSKDKRRYRGFSPPELVECLARMSHNDNNKLKIEEAGALPELVKMMKYSDLEENTAAAHNVWILCFDKNIREKVKAEPGMLEALTKLKDSPDRSTSKAAKGALWTINEGHKVGELSKKKEKVTTADGGHVFISYQTTYQTMVKKLNSRLKEAGYRTWVDVEQMGGSTLEAMAEAVERASVVLICAAESYKTSPNCRTEAEYTFQLKKDILPLMMQRKYKADGWLGMLLGAKYYINFDGKFEFDEAFDMLLKELGGRGKEGVSVTDGPDIHPAANTAVVSSAPASKPNYSTWSVKEVDKFFTDAGLNNVKPHFKGYDGAMLAQLRSLKTEAPDFFYRHLETKMNLTLKDIILLVSAMKTL